MDEFRGDGISAVSDASAVGGRVHWTSDVELAASIWLHRHLDTALRRHGIKLTMRSLARATRVLMWA